MSEDSQKGELLYTERNWIPDFLNPISVPYCSWDDALNVLKRYNDYNPSMNRMELEYALSEYGIFSVGKWAEIKEFFCSLDNETR